MKKILNRLLIEAQKWDISTVLACMANRESTLFMAHIFLSVKFVNARLYLGSNFFLLFFHMILPPCLSIVYAVNTRGSFLMTKYSLLEMKKRNYGRILLIASIAGKEVGSESLMAPGRPILGLDISVTFQNQPLSWSLFAIKKFPFTLYLSIKSGNVMLHNKI